MLLPCIVNSGDDISFIYPYSWLLLKFRALSEVPTTKIVTGVRIGLVGDQFIVNPTTKEMEESELDLILAGTHNAILMIEVYSWFLFNQLKLHDFWCLYHLLCEFDTEIGAICYVFWWNICRHVFFWWQDVWWGFYNNLNSMKLSRKDTHIDASKHVKNGS